MGDLSLNLSRKEIACKCGCGYDSIDVETIHVVQDMCDHFARFLGQSKVILIVNSGCRCFAWNDHINGSTDSLHMESRAIDFRIKEVSIKLVAEYLLNKYKGKYGIGIYDTFIHLDTRTDGPARW